MSLAPVKREILETLLLHDKPLRATQIAKETGKEFPPVMMHLIGLTRIGYANSPEKSQYTITEKGKRALGVPEVSRENAEAILSQTPHEKAFHFYAGVGKPLNLFAHNLRDFCEKILKVNIDSIEFHMSRGDFSAWFAGIGDAELAKKVMLLKEKKTAGEELRGKLCEIVENRCIVLAKMVGRTVPSE
jgi:DNA-binding HxlR family transcriptional regulator